MTRFAVRAATFAAPLGVLFALPVVCLWWAGEFVTADEIIALQKSNSRPVLVGKAYVPGEEDMRLRNVLERRLEVVALGNSRVLQFRSEFFRPGRRFYNAGGWVGHSRDYADFLERIPRGQEPKVVIVGLEHSYFNGGSVRPHEPRGARVQGVKRAGMLVNAVRGFYLDYFMGKFNLSRLFIRDPEVTVVGLNALVNRDATRNDGSHYYGRFLANPHDPRHPDHNFRDTFTRINKGMNLFAHGQEVAKEAVEDVERFLQSSRQRGIEVVGFLPPYAPAVYTRMRQEGVKYRYLDKIWPALRAVFDRYEYPLFDFSDLRQTGAADEEVIDGVHASEKATLRLFIKMVEETPGLQPYADLEGLRAKLASAKNPYEVVGR